MSSTLKNLSDFQASPEPDGTNRRIGIAVAEWNREVTFALRDGAVRTLLKYGTNAADIVVKHVPGSYELPLAASWLIDLAEVDAVICLGCVIQGETPHFEYICQAVSQGIMQLSLETGVPVIFGVLTTLNQEQAMDRAGGKHGNKGDEAAYTALRMLDTEDELMEEYNPEDAGEEDNDDNLIEFP